MLPRVIITHELPSEWIVSLQGRCQSITGPSAEAGGTGGLTPELEARQM